MKHYLGIYSGKYGVIVVRINAYTLQEGKEKFSGHLFECGIKPKKSTIMRVLEIDEIDTL